MGKSCLFIFYYTYIICYIPWDTLSFVPYCVSYAIIITITGSLLALIWLHASKDRLLVDKNMSPLYIRAVSLQAIAPPLIFASSIAISFVDIKIAQYFWILIVPAKIIIQRKYRY
jgi:hypothetical protein